MGWESQAATTSPRPGTAARPTAIKAWRATGSGSVLVAGVPREGSSQAADALSLLALLLTMVLVVVHERVTASDAGGHA